MTEQSYRTESKKFLAALLAGLLVPIFIRPVKAAATSVRIIDDGEAGFSLDTPSGWSRVANVGYNRAYYQTMVATKARWSFQVNSGSYRVYITWYCPDAPYNKGLSVGAPFVVKSGVSTLASGTINMQVKPTDKTVDGADWKSLGTVNVTTSPLEIHLTGVEGALVVIADAVRIERVDGQPIASPEITSIRPLNSPLNGAIPVSIYGHSFAQGCRVFFGNTEATKVTFVSSTELTAIAPTHNAGTVDIKVVNPDNLSAVIVNKFTFAKARFVDESDPDVDVIGDAGMTLNSGYQKDFLQIVGATSQISWMTFVNNIKPQYLAITWPTPGAPYNKAYSEDVLIRVFDGQTEIISMQANLQEMPDTFSDGGVGWLELGKFMFTSGKAKVVMINRVSNKTILGDAIRIEELEQVGANLTLTHITPAQGLLEGNTRVNLLGSNFKNGATVTFGGIPALQVQFISATNIMAITPSHASGAVDVVLTNPDSMSATIRNGFVYVQIAPPPDNQGNTGSPSDPGPHRVSPNPWNIKQHRGQDIVLTDVASGASGQVYNRQGQVILELIESNGEMRLNPDTLASGIYLIRVSDSDTRRISIVR